MAPEPAGEARAAEQPGGAGLRRETGKPSSSGLRPDIQALRAAAVVSVVLFHSWPDLVPGGCIGVDVFFVISGYLITTQLLKESDKTGTISLLDFWVRRARRLLPASFLVLAVSAGAILAWVPQGLWRQHLREVAASSLYVQNWALAADAVDYFAAANTPSPVQHFWTLSVEEQFYVALPLLMLVTLGVTRARPAAQRRRWLIAALGIAWLTSFAYSLWLTLESPPVAYFSTLTRAWEFGTGALLAFAPVPARVLWRRGAAGLGWLAIPIAGLAFGADTHLPGLAALVPVLAAATVIGGRGGAAAHWQWGGWRPITWVGDHSYSIYLWHWPLLVVAPHGLERDLGHMDRLVLNAVAIGLAWATTRWVEDPIRHGRWPTPPLSRRAVAGWSAAAMVALLVITQRGVARIDDLERASSELVERLASGEPACFGAEARRGGAACSNPELEDVLLPNPAVAGRDIDGHPGCRQGRGEELRICTLGPSTGFEKRLAAIGDSHVAALVPALEATAQKLRWRIDVAAKNACYWTTGTQNLGTNVAGVATCQRWKASLNRHLLAGEPYDAIIVTHRVGIWQPDAAPGETEEATIVRGLVESWKTQAERGTRIVAIVDNPTADPSSGTCVARHLLRANEFCSSRRALALGAFDGHIDATRALPGSTLIDFSDIYCDETSCPVVIGNVVVYRDDNHITKTFSRSLAPALIEQLQRILG